MKIKLAIICCIVAITSACNTIKKSEKVYVDDRVNNIVWSVISFKGHGLHPEDFPNGEPTVIFDMQNSKINGTDGCNNFMGIAHYTAGNIKPGAIASTKMACANASIQSDFYDVLASDKLSYKVNGDVLRLYVNDAEVMALKERQ